MITSIILTVVMVFIDGFITNFLSFSNLSLSLFTPMLTLITLIMIEPLFKMEKIKYYLFVILIGFIYDLLYTNIYLLNSTLFVLVLIIIHLLKHYIKTNFFTNILFLVLSIFLYDGLFSLLLIIINYRSISFVQYFYKATHSIILNVIYGMILYFIFQMIRGEKKKGKKYYLNKR